MVLVIYVIIVKERVGRKLESLVSVELINIMYSGYLKYMIMRMIILLRNVLMVGVRSVGFFCCDLLV